MNLIRNLLALFIITMMLEICMMAYQFIGNIKFDYNTINDDISIVQLRRILLLSYDVDFSSSNLSFIYEGKRFSLSMVNNRMILQPGTQIFLNDIESMYFTSEYGVYKVIYYRGGKEYEKALCPSRGIYIDDFSDCDVLYDECDSSED